MVPRELRYKAVIHYKHFLPSLRKVSRLYGVSKSSLQRWVHADPVFRKRRKKKEVQDCITDAINQCIAQNPFVTALDVSRHVASACNARMSRSTASRCIKRCGLSRKKAFRCVDYTHTLPVVQEFCDGYLQSEDIVCIDEAGLYVGDHCKRGYSPVGCRLRVKSGRTLRRSKFTLLLAVSASGIVGYEVLDHNCRKADFIRFIQGLQVRPGTTLVMDNIAFHHSKEVAEVAKLKGARLLFTPPYSPRGNAIENVFGALKHEYRSNCPPSACDSFDYESLLHVLLESWTNCNLRKFMARTRAWVQETRDMLLADPSAIERFCGYD
jgi:transposase